MLSAGSGAELHRQAREHLGCFHQFVDVMNSSTAWALRKSPPPYMMPRFLRGSTSTRSQRRISGHAPCGRHFLSVISATTSPIFSRTRDPARSRRLPVVEKAHAFHLKWVGLFQRFHRAVQERFHDLGLRGRADVEGDPAPAGNDVDRLPALEDADIDRVRPHERVGVERVSLHGIGQAIAFSMRSPLQRVPAVGGHPLRTYSYQSLPAPGILKIPGRWLPGHVVIGLRESVLLKTLFQKVAHARPSPDLVVHGGRENKIAPQGSPICRRTRQAMI